MHVNTATSICKVKNVIGIINQKTGKINPKQEKIVKPGQRALIEFECENELCVNKFKVEGFLGKVLVRHENMTVGIGQIVKICYE